jgi:peptidoglycan/LPS O-acetylase OafA/YrhL
MTYDNIVTHLLSSIAVLAGSSKDNHMAPEEAEGSSEAQDGDSSNPSLALFAYNLGKRSRKLLRPSSMMKTAGRGRNERTSYLDGLRGFGAFLVYWQHHQLWPRSIFNVRILESSFGFEGKYQLASLPIVRLFFTGGHFAVAIFLIISGYVLSAKPLALIHSGNLENLDKNLGSALFRRWIRLYGPVILVTFVYMASWHVFGIWTPEPKHKPDFREEIWNWYASH